MRRLIALVLLVSVSGCAHLAGPPLPPRDFALTLREAGGIAGRDAGLTVEPDGAVRSWGPGVPSVGGVLPEAARQALWSDVREHFRATEDDGGASLVRSIEVWARGTMQSAEWAPGTEPDLDALYESLWDTSQSGTWPTLDGEGAASRPP
ncbi:MAG: hypothetical protein AAF845_03475 [Bacteroidota bacterium]